jgi:hypothetical protein
MLLVDQVENLFIVAPARIIFATDVDEFDHVAIAFVGAVVEAEALNVAVASAVPAALLQAGHVVALRHCSESVRNVVQFVSNRVADGSQADDHRQNADCHDEDQFCRDDEASFVVQKCVECVSHLEFPLL